MTDPWSVKNTKEVTRHINLDNQPPDINKQNKSTDSEKDSLQLGFEDSFIQENNSSPLIETTTNNTLKDVTELEHQPLPDSETYLQSLERKLEKLKKGSKLVDALSEKREDSLRSMLQQSSTETCNNDLLLELEASITNSDSAAHNLYRQIQPVQPVTVGETVHIVKYDQLEEQRLEAEAKEQEENLPASR